MINLYDILKAANGQLFGEPAANLFTDFALDPHQIGENELFIALRTEQGDTHQYIEEAIQNGASGILCIDPPEANTEGVSVLMVRDTLDALMAWSRATLQKLNVRVIAVGGSSAKSVAVDAITRILATRYEVHRGVLDVPGRLSVPLSLAALNANHDYVVLKLDADRPGAMQQAVAAVQPTIVVINHIDCMHPAAFEDCAQYVEEQALLIEALTEGQLAIVNYDDEETRALARRARNGVVVQSIGIDRFGADALVFNVKVGLNSTGFDLRYRGDRYVARWSPILGQQQLYSLMAGVLVGVHLQIGVEEALRTLTRLEYLPGRMALLDGVNRSFLVDDSFHASYSSTMAALEWIRDVQEERQRSIFVVGDMDNLGDNSIPGHRSIGRRAAEIADVIVTQGVEASLIGRAAIDNGKDPRDVHTTYSAQDTIAVLQSLNLTQNDVVLVKGGYDARMEDVVRGLLAHPDDEQRLVRQGGSQQLEMRLPTLRPSWVEVDASALANNVRIIRGMLADDVALMAVVKADGYGHGAPLVARTALMNGASYLSVASMGEAIHLRNAGINAPILVLSYAPVDSVRIALRQNITLSVYDLEQAQRYDRAARNFEGKLKFHVKIDTGMGRLGIFADDAISTFRHFLAMQNLSLEGIYTHFSSAEEDDEYTAQQVETFTRLVRALRAGGFSFQYVHASNSPGLLRSPNNHFNMVRPGLILYGLQPSELAATPETMRPALSWKTSILQVKTFPPGYPIGYGNTYHTRDYERIAILPVGYADGLRRSPKTWRYVLIHGQQAPLVGRVSMEKCAVSVEDIPNVSAGDEVVLLGQQGDQEITAGMVAEWLETISYEVVTTILPRISRI